MPHVVQKQRSAVARRAARHEGHRLSQRARKRVEEVMDCLKAVASGRKLPYRGVDRNRFLMEMTTAGHNLVSHAKPTPVAA